ncbi:hypothetical protein ABEG61_21795 [Pantoea agglomerans]|uniref:hypothetical protein n=1 Tax=Enterobacter agglomerans TaxID=549 RepID=UPI00320AB9E0
MDTILIFISFTSIITALIAAYLSRKKRLQMEDDLKIFLARKDRAKRNFKKKSDDLHYH